MSIMEGFTKSGSLSQRNNNPLNLKFANQPYAVKKGVFAYFDTLEHGWQACYRQIKIVVKGTSHAYNYEAEKQFSLANCGEMTLLQFISVFAPKKDNNDPAKYTNFICGKLKVDPAFQMKQFT